MKKTLTYFLMRPKFWFGLIGFALSWLIARLPRLCHHWIALCLGQIMLKTAKRHKKIVETNLRLCFPHQDAKWRSNIIRQNAYLTGAGVMETSACWFSDLKNYLKHTQIEGLEHIEKALKKGKGIILLSFHTTGLEIGAQLLSHHKPIYGMYKPDKNPLIEFMLRRGRLKHLTGLIKQQNVREMVKHLKQNQIIWYAADQDYGKDKSSVFVPFFEIPAATITATSKFAAMTGAQVIPFTVTRENNISDYQLTIHPALEDFPSDSASKDATRINRILENYLKENPADYFWVHKRFKTRPNGEPSLYDN